MGSRSKRERRVFVSTVYNIRYDDDDGSPQSGGKTFARTGVAAVAALKRIERLRGESEIVPLAIINPLRQPRPQIVKW